MRFQCRKVWDPIIMECVLIYTTRKTRFHSYSSFRMYPTAPEVQAYSSFRGIRVLVTSGSICGSDLLFRCQSDYSDTLVCIIVVDLGRPV